MGTAWKVVVGLVLLLPMTAYVVGSLVAAADAPLEHQPIIVQEQTQKPDKAGPSPSQKPTEKPDDREGRQGEGHGVNGGPQVIVPPPSDLFDDHGGDDNSGKGSGDDDDDSSGKGSGDD